MQAEEAPFAAVEETVRAAVDWIELAVELMGAAVIALGVLLAAWHFARHALGARAAGTCASG